MSAADRPLWTPDAARVDQTRLAGFFDATKFGAYVDAHRWSVEHPSDFWTAVWRECGMPGEPGTAMRRGKWFGDTQFFPEASLNVAQVVLEGGGAAPDEAMWVQRDETGRRREVTRAEAVGLVAAAAAALRADGVVAGDRVVAWLPNIVETQVVMLAAASIGAVFSSTSPDFGVDGVVDRFGQIEPVVLVAVDGYHYGGKVIDCRAKLADIQSGLPTLRRTVLVSNVWPDDPPVAGSTSWDQWLEPYRGAVPVYEQLPFDQPWLVLFSSGTTGVPKCIVHRAGGVLIQHLKEHQLHCDISAGDRVMYFTTAGWMMWNWLSTVPASGATAVLYDGSPFHPSPAALFDIAQEERLTFLGVGAKFLDSVRKEGLSPRTTHQLPALRTVASTGSPLSVEGFEWVYRDLHPEVHLASISGGTDLCGCFVGGDPTSAVYAGEIQRPALGMAVEVWGEDGRAVPVGERGELVCTVPFPSIPLGFWGDDGTRFRAAYFDRFPGVWAHGDFASWTKHGGMVIHGRSDTTLNPGGVRIGTAEIYRQVEQLPQIVESLVFGQEWDDDTRIVLLVRLADGSVLDDELVAAIRDRVRTGCTPRHVPAVVLAVDDLPRTRSGKLVELAVADAVNGREVRNTTALANPESLAAIVARLELAVL